MQMASFQWFAGLRQYALFVGVVLERADSRPQSQGRAVFLAPWPGMLLFIAARRRGRSAAR